MDNDDDEGGLESSTKSEEMPMDWFKKKKETAVMQLGVLCGNPVENSEQGVHDALECVFAHGSYADGAKAVMIVSQWMWANCEEAYHSEKQGE